MSYRIAPEAVIVAIESDKANEKDGHDTTRVRATLSSVFQVVACVAALCLFIKFIAHGFVLLLALP